MKDSHFEEVRESILIAMEGKVLSYTREEIRLEAFKTFEARKVDFNTCFMRMRNSNEIIKTGLTYFESPLYRTGTRQ